MIWSVGVKWRLGSNAQSSIWLITSQAVKQQTVNAIIRKTMRLRTRGHGVPRVFHRSMHVRRRRGNDIGSLAHLLRNDSFFTSLGQRERRQQPEPHAR
jgi:hypothetical protein